MLAASLRLRVTEHGAYMTAPMLLPSIAADVALTVNRV